MHISLDQALGRQPRLNRVGQSLLNIGEDAAAAYSLRSLTGGDPKVVNVRRSGDNDEREFTASGVNAELEDWVNGKLEITLPADVDAAAAAYSLRKVRNAYTGNAVQIRREFDDTEADVAFDDNDEVSTSSAITVTSGSSTATTLGDFIVPTEVQPLLGNRMHFDGVNDYVEDVILITDPHNFDVSVTLLDQGSGNRVIYSRGNTASNDPVFVIGILSGQTQPYLQIRESIGSDDINYQFNTPNLSDGSFHTLRIVNVNGSVTCFVDGNEEDSTSYTPSASPTFNTGGIGALLRTSVSVSFAGVIYDATGTSSYEGYGNTDSDWLDTSGNGNNGTVYGSPALFTGQGFDAAVVTWYDQSGNSNDATQATAGSQPLIAEGGTYLGELDFDGSHQLLASTGNLAQPNSVFHVNSLRTAAVSYVYDSQSSSNRNAFNYDTFRRFRIYSGTGSNASNVSLNEDNLFFGLHNSTSSSLFKNGTAEYENQDTGSQSLDNLSIGQDYQSQKGLDGTIKEIIFYNSDQSDNRFKIESNINNHYQIDGYKVHYEYDLTTGNGGFETTSGCTIVSNQTVGGRDECLEVTSNAGSGLNLIKDSQYPSSSGSFVIEGEIYIDPSNVSLKQIVFALDSSSGRGFKPLVITDSGWSSFRFSFDTTSVSDDLQLVGRDVNGDSSFTRTAGDVFAIRNVKSKFAENGFVETWFDQSGNGNDAADATSLTLNDQPQIVRAGSYLGELDFDGTDDFLQFSAADVGNNDVISAFLAATGPTVGNTTTLGSAIDYSMRRDGSNRVISLTNANTFRLDGTDFTYSNGNTRLVTLIRDLSVPSGLLALDGNVQDTISASYELVNTYQIGAKLSGSSYVGFADFECKELIVYATNQTSNRTAIESNIADEYGITLS